MTSWKSLLRSEKEELLQRATLCLALESQRDAVLQTMKGPVKDQVHRSDATRADLIAIFDTLDNFDGAWQEFVEALSFLEQDSTPSQEFAEKALQLKLTLGTPAGLEGSVSFESIASVNLLSNLTIILWMFNVAYFVIKRFNSDNLSVEFPIICNILNMLLGFMQVHKLKGVELGDAFKISVDDEFYILLIYKYVNLIGSFLMLMMFLVTYVVLNHFNDDAFLWLAFMSVIGFAVDAAVTIFAIRSRILPKR